MILLIKSKLNNDMHLSSSQNKQIFNKVRIIIAILAVVVCSLHVQNVTMNVLNHSRNLSRVLNRVLLLHDSLDIYWFGYRTGQYLINYPIQEYYKVGQVSEFLQRVQLAFGNLESLFFGKFEQQIFNKTQQKIIAYYTNGTVHQYSWTVQTGFEQPFSSTNIQEIKSELSNIKIIQISINCLKATVQENGKSQLREWEIALTLQPFEQTSVFANIFVNEILWMGWNHLLHLVVGFGTVVFIIFDVRSRQGTISTLQKFELTDIPDLLVGFFLIYSSFASFVGIYTVKYLVILDGITCFICWLYVIKIYTENQSYHISFLIKRSYLLVGRLFVSFGPMFIGFCLFALTAFCRYTDLFVSFHKAFISLFCVCYYNMTYQQYRTTQRSNPISAVFFTTLIMLFTVCIYSGMLVSAFCSYMWNKRQDKNKKQLIASLKIECSSCHKKYSYKQGAKASLQLARNTKIIIDLQTVDPIQHKKDIISKSKFLSKTANVLLLKNSQIMVQYALQEKLYLSILTQWMQKVNQINQKVKLQI